MTEQQLLGDGFGGIMRLALPVMLLLLLVSLRRKSGEGLHQAYPAVEPAVGTRRTLERVVFGKAPRMTWVKVGVDHTHLHVSVVGSLRSQAGFSVPLAEVSAEPDRYPWMILAPDVIRLSFARQPGECMLVWPKTFAKLTAESQGRLRVAAPSGHAGDASAGTGKPA